jgi:hypothetical protein
VQAEEEGKNDFFTKNDRLEEMNCRKKIHDSAAADIDISSGALEARQIIHRVVLSAPITCICPSTLSSHCALISWLAGL